MLLWFVLRVQKEKLFNIYIIIPQSEEGLIITVFYQILSKLEQFNCELYFHCVIAST